LAITMQARGGAGHLHIEHTSKHISGHSLQAEPRTRRVKELLMKETNNYGYTPSLSRKQ
jgi:hypothetical protein